MLGIKEELSGLIGELKNDVDDKATKIEEDRKAQEAAFEALNNELKEIKEEFKAEGACCGSTFFSLLRFSVKENKESSLDAQNQLREEILGKLEDTNRSIDQVGILKQNICEDCECFDTFALRLAGISSTGLTV